MPLLSNQKSSKNLFQIDVRSLLFIISIFLCGVYLFKNHRFEGNILSLLPPVYQDVLVEKAALTQAERMSGRVLLLIQGKDVGSIEKAAVEAAHKMRESGFFSVVEERVSNSRLDALRELFLSHPFQLSIPPPTLEELLAQASEHAFSPEGLLFLQTVEKDPLLLFPTYLQSTLNIGGQFSIENGFIRVRDGNQQSILILAQLTPAPTRDPTEGAISKFFKILPLTIHGDGISIVTAGMVFFAEAAATTTRDEITIISTLTLVVLTTVMVVVFRSLRPVILTSICVLSSFLVAIALSDIAWNYFFAHPLHLITIGFGSSLLGVSSDYALHYFIAQRTSQSEQVTGLLYRVTSGIFLGFITTVIGFLGIALSPFPGLKQLALFCCIGLTASITFVLFILPRVSGKPFYDERLAALTRLTARLHSARMYQIWCVALLLLAVLGLPSLEVIDDIRALSTPPRHLIENQKRVTAVLGMSDGGTLVVVRGKNEEEVLQREESLIPHLELLKSQGKISGYRAVSTLFPSLSSQKNRYTSFSNLLRSDPARVERYISELHLPPATQSLLNKVRDETLEPRTVSIKEKILNPAFDPVRDLWIGELEGQVVSTIMLSGVTTKNLSPLNTSEGLSLINQADSISYALKRYRTTASLYTAAFYLVIVLLLIVRYGIGHSLRIITPTFLGSIAALSALGLTGVPINAFSVFALIVLLGISIDYAIFFAEDDDHHHATGFTVLFSALTTTISFGLLSISSTPALQSFGVVLSVGSIFAALFAPFAARDRK